MAFDAEKLRALVHYIIAKAGAPERLGSTKLNKILWFVDARAFVVEGQPITGEIYVRQKYGPVAKHLRGAINHLQASGAIRVNRRKLDDYQQDIYRPLTNPDVSFLTKDQQQSVDYWIRHIVDDHSAKSISEQSHDTGWEIAQMGEVLPYGAFWADRIRSPRGRELEWAKKVADNLRPK